MNPSTHGNKFKEEVRQFLLKLRENRIIKTVQVRLRFNHSIGLTDQFYASVLVEVDNQNVVIFTTTSARSDRIKTNQWDALGIKKSLPDKTNCILVLPDSLSLKEESNYKKELARIKDTNYFSALDAIIKVSDLKKYLMNLMAEDF